jgi:predicted anti-sigma-YlaC factor YlaD
MKPCPDRHDTILLAAYGELSPAERTVWEKHATACPGCREEYEALLRLLGRIKAAMPVPELSEKRASSILWSVKQELRKELEKASWWKEWLARPGRLVPALATACIVLITFGWFGMDLIQSPDTDRDSMGPIAENQTVLQDLEIIKNIEFLEEMDTVQELVTVLDRNESI